MPFVDPEGFSGGLWPHGYRAAGARYPRKRSPWNSACGATGRTQMAPVLGSVRAPLDLVPELPMKSCSAITSQEEIRTAGILTPADFIGHQAARS